MVKKGPIIMLGVGIVVALVVSVISYNVLKGKAQKQLQTQETVEIAVAISDLPWGTVLGKEHIRTAPFLKKSLPAGFQTNAAALEGRVLVYPVRSNEPISESSLAPREMKSGGMAAVVKQDKRAMAVKVDKVVGVSGFIFPGNRIDVLVTIRAQGENKGTITKTVLENLLVLATGSEVTKTGKQEAPSTVDVITLEVTPEEGEKLALASSEGKVQLSLRNFSDVAEVVTKGTTLPILLDSYKSESSGKLAAVPGAQRSPTRSRAGVMLIQGSKVSITNFYQGE